MAELPTPAPKPSARPAALGALVVGWLIPGASFMMYGRWARGATQFVMVMATLALGLALRSSIAWPTWSIRSEDFNLINNFTFIIQMGCGVPGLVLFWASSAGDSLPEALRFLAGVAHGPYFELGNYFLIVAGALNYFALGNFYDRHIQIQPRFEPQELAGPEGDVA